MTDDSILLGELCEKIASGFERFLRAQSDPILDGVVTPRLVQSRARSALDDVIDSYRAVIDKFDCDAEEAENSARQVTVGIRSTETSGTASVLLPADERPDIEIDAVSALHRMIARRVVLSATSYTGVMLRAVRASHRAELAHLARELHDRTAHTISVAIQNLELHEVHVGRDTDQAQEKLLRAREAMEHALDSVRNFLGELRSTVRPDELEQALAKYLAANAGNGILTSIKASGDTALLPADVCEEVYVTLREAIRNALVHSEATRLDVSLEIIESRLHARVSDTGRGFSVEQATRFSEGIGLSSMRERVELLGGRLGLTSVPGHGTTVEISIPLGPVPR